MPSRTVDSARRVWSDTNHQLSLREIQRVFQWTQSLDRRHAYTLALPPEIMKPYFSEIPILQPNTLVQVLERHFLQTELAGSTILRVLVSLLTRRALVA